MGFLFYFLTVPGVLAAIAVAAVIGRTASTGRRLTVLTGLASVVVGANLVISTGGISGGGGSDIQWRWSQTPEERLLAAGTRDAPSTSVSAPPGLGSSVRQEAGLPAPAAAPAPAANAAVVSVSTPSGSGTPAVERSITETPDARAMWPGFRGPLRNAVVPGVRIETDWTRAAPVVVWRRPIGPGWSSFAVDADVFVTQEQRGGEELVSAYRVSSGEPVWRHADSVRFWESNAGAGPRATPTVAGGRVFALGATGILNALDARTGAGVWWRDAAKDTGKTTPYWGFAGSPLVMDDVVVVAAAGRLAGYDRATGTPRWQGPDRGGGYSSPHDVTIDGVRQVVLLHTSGATSVQGTDGTVLWEHQWEGGAIVQPAVGPDGHLLINSLGLTGGVGIRRLAVSKASSAWAAEERWTSRGLKPYYSDFVVHAGHAYGFDGTILACIDLADGTRKWKGGRYGSGQLLLLPDQDLLLVVSEEGEIALVAASPEGFVERARFKAIDGKTWNHPALVGDTLLVRNGQEMAAVRLPIAR
jgi:outer membrane protein assembly factor BamB